MNKIIFKFVVTAFFVLGFVSCDKIEGPFVTPSEVEDVTVTFPELNVDEVFRKILVEEYTAHYCHNCPDGHVELERLHGIYGDTLVIVGIHAGPLAAPQAMDSIYSYDFCTHVGDELHSFFNIDPIPVAIINRHPDIWSLQRWQSKLAAADRTVYAAIQLVNQYGVLKSDVLKVNAKVTMLADYPNPVRLSLFLIENDVVKPQRYHSETILDYTHQHVLRAGLNGTFGDFLTPSGLLEKNASYKYGRSISFARHDWNPDNCYVVAVLHDKSNGEVLQVEQVKVK